MSQNFETSVTMTKRLWNNVYIT